MAFLSLGLSKVKKNEVDKMKVLDKKEGGFYNNKILVASVLVLMIVGLAWVVIATLTLVTLNKPDDASVVWNATSIDFNCTANGNEIPGNMTLWHNFSGTWEPNVTRTSGMALGFPPLNITLQSVGDVFLAVWNCEFNDSAGTLFATSNNTISIDGTAPTAFNLRNATPNATVTQTNDFILLNWTATVEDHFINYTLLVYNSTTYSSTNLIVRNISDSISTNYLNVSPLEPGNFTDDTYHWYVLAYENDAAGRDPRPSSQNFTFIVDTEFTNITLNAPGNNTWDNDGDVVFNYTVNDNNVDTCTIYYNVTGSGFIANQTNTSLSDGDTVFSSPAVPLDDANYTWYVWCNDTGGNEENSSQWIIKVDDTDPVVGLNSPLNATYSTSGVVSFNFTTVETYPDKCILWHNESDWASNQTASYTNGLYTVFDPINFSNNGTYLWNVWCNDSAGNAVFNGTNYTLYVDTDGPILSLVAPENNSYSATSYVVFNYTANDTFLDTCILYGNFSETWDTNQTNSSLTQGSEVAVWANLTLDDGYYIWNALCNDSAEHSTWLKTDGNYTVTVDTTYPTEPTLGNVLLDGIYYGNNTLGSDQTPTVNWTSVTEINFANYTIQFANHTNFAAANIINESYQTNKTNPSVTIGSGLSDNTTYYWKVTAYDLAGNSNASGWFNYTTDFTNVSIEPIEPSTLATIATTAYSTSATVSFVYNITDVNPDTCILWGNFSETWGTNQSNSSFGSEVIDTQVNVTLTLSNGTYAWNVWCNDSAHPANANWANSTTNFTLIVDTSTPTITPVTTNDSTTKDRVIEFTVTANSVTAINRSSIAVTPNASAGSNLNYTNDCVSDGSNGYNCYYIETGLTAGETNILNISVKNNAGTSATIYNLYITPSAAYNFTIALASGWNLISTPLILENSSIDNIWANNSHISSMYYYSGSGWSWWFSNGTDTISTMEPLKGYWLYTTAATNLFFFGNTTTGTQPSGYGMSNPRSLSASTWYLIGHYTPDLTTNYNTDDALSAMCTGDVCSGASTLKFGALDWYNTSSPPTLTPLVKSEYDTDAIWDNGRGFWIYMTTAHDPFQGTPP